MDEAKVTTPEFFEQEVRRIARLRWPSAEFAGSELEGGRERDGIFITEDCVHLVECTTSRQLDKARTDLSKLFGLYKQYSKSHRDRAVKCWFVTLHEPTAEQRNVRKEVKNAAESIFNVVSFAQFQAKLIDSHEYLQCRDRHRFGSVSDPATGAIADIKYIRVALLVAGHEQPYSIEQLADLLLNGTHYSILGEYGVGKSMTLREIFKSLAEKHRKRETLQFPVYLNLREHQGQQEPAEILERHARNIGFSKPHQLVRAWKAGFVTLLIDGFDEVSSQGLQGAWRRLREARRASMAGVRRLIRDSPTSCGIAIAGRDNFFNTSAERKEALGQLSSWIDVRLDEFGEQQIAELADQLGIVGNIPSWIPSRPLLLTTLFAHGASADDVANLALMQEPAAGWDLLLNEISHREARIEAGISGDNIRAILESLSTLARSKDGGLGPLSPADDLTPRMEPFLKLGLGMLQR